MQPPFQMRAISLKGSTAPSCTRRSSSRDEDPCPERRRRSSPHRARRERPVDQSLRRRRLTLARVSGAGENLRSARAHARTSGSTRRARPSRPRRCSEPGPRARARPATVQRPVPFWAALSSTRIDQIAATDRGSLAPSKICRRDLDEEGLQGAAVPLARRRSASRLAGSSPPISLST